MNAVAVKCEWSVERCERLGKSGRIFGTVDVKDKWN
jgi:hypothetical protein